MDYLAHHGIKGQKHGVRRWQNQDGSLTPEGYPHYGYKGPRDKKKKLTIAPIVGTAAGIGAGLAAAAATGPASSAVYLGAAMMGAMPGLWGGTLYTLAKNSKETQSGNQFLNSSLNSARMHQEMARLNNMAANNAMRANLNTINHLNSITMPTHIHHPISI